MASIIVHSGIVRLTRGNLERLKAEGRKVNINMTGMLVLARDITPKLALETIGQLAVRGIISASGVTKKALRQKQAA